MYYIQLCENLVLSELKFLLKLYVNNLYYDSSDAYRIQIKNDHLNIYSLLSW